MNQKKPQKAETTKSSSGHKYLLQMTRRGVFLGICLMFLISAWMFVLGVLVGRGTAPVHFDIEVLQKELIALKESIIKQEQERMRADAPVEKSGDLDFYEALKGAQKEETLKLKPLEKSSAVSDNAAPEEAGPDTKTLTSMKKKTKKGSTARQEGGFEVQVASTKDVKAADQLIEKLAARGFEAYKAQVEVSGKGTWYRVRTAGFASRDAAEKANAEIAKMGYKGMVVKK